MNKHWCRGGVNGFTIQYATNPDFSGDCKSVTSRLKENRKKIFDSPANTYYMRVRAFKHIGDWRYTSAWSQAEKVVLTD